jgi:hypothetical protein
MIQQSARRSDMSYKIKNGKTVRVERRRVFFTPPPNTLYHFTPPFNLPSIHEHGFLPNVKEYYASMTGGGEVVWFTSNPDGNLITEAYLAYWREAGKDGLLAEYAAGRRFAFGFNDYGGARITVDLARGNDPVSVINYLEWMKKDGDRDAWSDPSSRVRKALPDVTNWWVAFETIPAYCITAICPVGDETPHYREACEKIIKESGARRLL